MPNLSRTLRKEYMKKPLRILDFKINPLSQFDVWLAEAIKAKISEPNAAALATADSHGRPSARFVLIKGVNNKGITFFTNYLSRKGAEIKKQPWVALVIYWPKLSRQIRIEGRAVKLGSAESDKYFNSRPRGAQVAATVSQQSQKLSSYEDLLARFELADESLPTRSVKRPTNWGGYIVKPTRFEFWQGQRNRMHQRVEYHRIRGRWRRYILSP